MRVLELGGCLLGFYEGRDLGERVPVGWVEDGALSLGICSYSLLVGDEALVYDTHVSVDRGRAIRAELERRGARSIRVVLSHWHLDHVAGTAAFADCEVIANADTAALLERHRTRIEAGTLSGPPAVAPLVMPTTTFESELALAVGGVEVELHRFEVHSSDATVVRLPETGTLLAGDTLEDTVTYVDEPDRLEVHLVELERLRKLGATRLYPCHGSPTRIAGGYAATLLDATAAYVERLLTTRGDPLAAHDDLATFVRPELESGWIEWFGPYQSVHSANLAAVRRADES